MKGKKQGEFETYQLKLENRWNEQFIRQQKALAREKSKERTKKFKDKVNKLNEIKECIEKTKNI